MNIKLVSLLLGFYILLLTGCASLYKVEFKYDSVMPKESNKNVTVFIDDLVDFRSVTDKKEVGTLYTELMAKYWTEDNLVKWIKDAMTVELKNTGYNISDDAVNANYIIEGKILEVYQNVRQKGLFSTITQAMYSDASIVVEFTVKQAGKEIFSKRYSKNKTNMSTLVSATFQWALQDLLKEFIADINTKIADNGVVNKE